MNKARLVMLVRASVFMVLVALASTGSHAQQGQDEREPGKFSAIAGTVLQLAAMNYTGPHQQLAQSVVTMFNGGAPQSQQA